MLLFRKSVRCRGLAIRACLLRITIVLLTLRKIEVLRTVL